MIYQPSRQVPGMSLWRRGRDAAGGGGGISISQLTSGSATSEPATTASISPNSDSQVIVSFAWACSNVSVGTSSVSGCNLTWTEISSLSYGTRRRLSVFRGTGGSPSSGSLTLSISGNGDPFQEIFWSVCEATGVNTTTPTSNVATNTSASATSLSVTIGGTVDSGDFTFCLFGMENASDSASFEAGLTQLSLQETGGNVRTLGVAYDGTPAIDQTPTFSWSSSGSVGGIGFILETA